MRVRRSIDSYRINVVIDVPDEQKGDPIMSDEAQLGGLPVLFVDEDMAFGFRESFGACDAHSQWCTRGTPDEARSSPMAWVTATGVS